MSYQKVILQGNLTKDAETRQVGQSQVASIGVATSERYKKADGTTVEETEFHDVEVWNMTGVAPYLTKGASVLVEGRIKTDKWTDNQGFAHERKKIRADVLRLCGPRPQSQQTAQPQAPAAPPQYQQAPPQYNQPAPPPQQQYQQAPPAPQYATPPQPQYQQGTIDDMPF